MPPDRQLTQALDHDSNLLHQDSLGAPTLKMRSTLTQDSLDAPVLTTGSTLGADSMPDTQPMEDEVMFGTCFGATPEAVPLAPPETIRTEEAPSSQSSMTAVKREPRTFYIMRLKRKPKVCVGGTTAEAPVVASVAPAAVVPLLQGAPAPVGPGAPKDVAIPAATATPLMVPQAPTEPELARPLVPPEGVMPLAPLPEPAAAPAATPTANPMVPQAPTLLAPEVDMPQAPLPEPAAASAATPTAIPMVPQAPTQPAPDMGMTPAPLPAVPQALPVPEMGAAPAPLPAVVATLAATMPQVQPAPAMAATPAPLPAVVATLAATLVGSPVQVPSPQVPEPTTPLGMPAPRLPAVAMGPPAAKDSTMCRCLHYSLVWAQVPFEHAP